MFLLRCSAGTGMHRIPVFSDGSHVWSGLVYDLRLHFSLLAACLRVPLLFWQR
jgi:hypothetical protein